MSRRYARSRAERQSDTPLNRAFIRKTMIAAVRRARRPGCKFDTITVLESPEGWNKSGFWRVLAGDDFYSDQGIIGQQARDQPPQPLRQGEIPQATSGILAQVRGTWFDMCPKRPTKRKDVRANRGRLSRHGPSCLPSWRGPSY